MSDPDFRLDRQGGDAPLRMDDHRQRRSRGPAPVTLIVSLLLLVGVGGGVLYMYRSGVKSADSAPRELGKPLGDVRARAPGGENGSDAAPGLSISRDDSSAGASVPTLAAPPEEPIPPAPAPGPAAVPSGPVVTPPPGSTAPPAQPTSGAPPPPPPESGSTPATHRPPARADARPQSIDQLLARSDSAPPDAADRAKAERLRAERTKADAAKADRARPAKTEPNTRDGDGPVIVQIGAFSSERLADEEWSKAAAISPGVMAGKGKRVVPIAKDGGTLYRTSITGFSSRDQALALCDRLRASGGHCFVH